MVGKTKIQRSSLSPSQPTSLIKVQLLDTDIANMTAESLNFWLIKFVLLILCKSKFTVCETLNMHLTYHLLCQLRVDNKLIFISHVQCLYF